MTARPLTRAECEEAQRFNEDTMEPSGDLDRAISSYRAAMEAIGECENALSDYVDRLEHFGATMGYGRGVLRKIRALIALYDGTGAGEEGGA